MLLPFGLQGATLAMREFLYEATPEKSACRLVGRLVSQLNVRRLICNAICIFVRFLYRFHCLSLSDNRSLAAEPCLNTNSAHILCASCL